VVEAIQLNHDKQRLAAWNGRQLPLTQL